MLKCKICGADTRIIKDNQFHIDYYKCLDCDFIFMDDEKRVSFDDEREVYDRHENSIECDGYVSMFMNFLDNAVTPYKKEGLALDFGSGPEPVLMQLINRDYNFEMENYDLHYQPKKVFLGKKYDLVVSTEVVEHLPDPIKVFKMVYDILDKDGIFAFMTVLHENDDEKFTKWWYRRDTTHISFYSKQTLETIARNIGFSFIYSDDNRMFTFKK